MAIQLNMHRRLDKPFSASTPLRRFVGRGMLAAQRSGYMCSFRSTRSRLPQPQAFPLDINGIKLSVHRATDKLARDLPEILKLALARVDPWAESKHHAVKQAIIDLYCNLNRETAEAVLAPDFVVHKAGYERVFSRSEYISLMYDTILPAIPDYQWCHASNYETDNDGWVLVTVEACGHHKGEPFCLPGLPCVAASGRHFSLEEEAHMVRVLEGKVQEIKVFPVRGSGPKALYTALGGEIPEPQLVSAMEKEQLPLP